MCEILGKSFITLNGHKFPISYCQKNIDFAINYKPLESDIILVTYPKCGTTWTQQIINLILNDGNPVNDKNFVNNTCIEYKGNDCIRSPIIKTHLPFNLLPFNKSTKYVYVIRNPKDTIVSYYNHMKIKFGYDFHKFFDQFICGQIPYGDYFDHWLSYMSHRFDDNFCFLIYEQMKAEPREAVLKLAQFCGQKYCDKLFENNESILNKILEKSSIEFMREDLKSNEYIVRKGIVGQWKQYFNKEESDLIENRFYLCFRGTELYPIWQQSMEC